ncbi:hypothetical protein HS125_20110 [bacterium]|nr:hypothetical protein [bacterium]
MGKSEITVTPAGGLRFYGLKENSSWTLTRSFSFTEKHAEAFDIYATASASGNIEITGRGGAGKTTLCRAPRASLKIPRSPSSQSLLRRRTARTINEELYIDAGGCCEGALTRQRPFPSSSTAGLQCGVAIDEAQNLLIRRREQIRT